MPAEPEKPDQIAPETPKPDNEDLDEAVTFTPEELRAMEAEGLTLDDAIRAIESRLG